MTVQSSDQKPVDSQMPQDFLTNPSHALFLHASDNPNNVLVSELHDGCNYGHCIRAMEVALIGENKIGFVRGTVTRVDASTPALQAQWDRLYNKGRKLAAAAQLDHNTHSSQTATSQALCSQPALSTGSAPVPGLTAEQYTQLFTLLQKGSSENSEAFTF